MIKRSTWEILYKAILLVLVFLLASEPALVAAKPQEVDPRQEAIDTLTISGDAYLTNSATAISIGIEVVDSLTAIKTTPLSQISENAVAQARANALKAAEASASALGSVDNIANSIESFGSNLPEDFDVFQRAAEGLPQKMRDDLTQQAGLTSTEVETISSGMDDVLLERQSMATSGMPADIALQLSQAGFSQAEIDQIAAVAGTRGLVNTSLMTSLAQFRASQDEWADVRTQLLILNVQLIGYQIGARQANGIEPRAVTDAELQEIADDEMRLLIHVAHLQELWGVDPSLNVGEGDWWFIEHYAGKAAERLDALVIETQNRGLIQDLFVLQQMKLLALSAKNGDADYVKAELDGLGESLSYLVGDQTFISKQRDELKGLAYVAARLASYPNLRERVQWPIDPEISSGAAKNAMLRMQVQGVQDMAPLLGVITEQNENNNIKGLLFIAGLPYIDQKLAEVVNTIQTIALDINQQSLGELMHAILTGDTTNHLLLATNLFIGMIPVINVIADVVSLASENETFIKALLIFGLICDLGESLALLPGLVLLAGAYIGRATTGVVGFLFRNTDDTLFKGILNGLRLQDAFKAVVDLMQVPSKNVPAGNLNSIVQFLDDFFKGETQFWQNYIAYVNRVGPTGLLANGFDEGAALAGQILRQGGTFSDEAVSGVRNVGKQLIEAGVDFSDDAAQGLGKLANTMNGSDFQRFINMLGNACSVRAIRPATKIAMPVRLAGSICNPQLVKKVLTSYKLFDDATLTAAGKLAQKVGPDNFTKWMLSFASNPDDLNEAQALFTKLASFENLSSTALNKAMEQGPDAVRAFSHWDNLLNNPDLGVELAERASKDAEAIRIVSTWTTTSTPNLEIVAKYSTNGNGRLFALGPGGEFDNPLGWVQFARENHADYYFTNPKVSEIITNLYPDEGAQRLVFLSINEAALDRPGGPIEKGIDFLYQINSLNPYDTAAAQKIWEGANDAAIKTELRLKPEDNLPFRMEELKLLHNNGYGISPKADGNLLFTLKPVPAP